MLIKSLKTKILLSLTAVIIVLSLSIAVLGYVIINKDIIERTQKRVDTNIKAARAFLYTEVDNIGKALDLITFDGNTEKLKEKLKLDYLNTATITEALNSPSQIVRLAAVNNQNTGAIRIIKKDELKNLPPQVIARAEIPIVDTLKAEPTNKKMLESAMAKEFAIVTTEPDTNKKIILYGGKIINQDNALVDKVRELVFGNELYENKPVGTVTIFQGDTRIATNVRNKNGQRAIGTRVSAEVYKKVVQEGQEFQDRAFVVTHWYRTAYEPIKDIEGKTIGILYVGILEKQFQDMAKNAMLVFLAIVITATVFAGLLAFLMAATIVRPITELVEATKVISDGNLGHTVEMKTNITELKRLAEAFNEMSTKLNEREKSLSVSNKKLEDSNKSNMELISFVAHELKGILASAVMNVYSVRDGFLGMINFKQKKAIDSVARNLDYLTATVKKFLNLGRIEKGDMSVHKSNVNMKKEIFDVAINSLANTAQNRGLDIQNNIDENISFWADADLMQVVANNLISNAIKYSTEKGSIVITSKREEKKDIIEVYNDSEPITAQQAEKLFKKFSRLDRTDTKRVKGSGLGLYITKQIVESHGGKISVVPKQNGNSFIFDIERSLDNGNTA